MFREASWLNRCALYQYNNPKSKPLFVGMTIYFLIKHIWWKKKTAMFKIPKKKKRKTFKSMKKLQGEMEFLPVLGVVTWPAGKAWKA